MAGVKGRSGRKPPAVDCDLRLRVIQRSWQILEETLNDVNVKSDVKIEIALKIAPKNIPTELAGGFTANVVMMGTVTKNGDKLEFNIGGQVDPAEDTGHTEQVNPDN